MAYHSGANTYYDLADGLGSTLKTVDATVACGASILAVVAVTGAIWLMINDRVNDGKLSQSQGQCLRAVNLLPIPFPLSGLKGRGVRRNVRTGRWRRIRRP